jgi:hypothetical protein
VFRVRMRWLRSSFSWLASVDPMNTRLMFVPPEFATSSVSGLFEMNMPHGSEPTATFVAANPLFAVELCHTSSRLNAVFERKTFPRAASTAMSPMMPW